MYRAYEDPFRRLRHLSCHGTPRPPERRAPHDKGHPTRLNGGHPMASPKGGGQMDGAGAARHRSLPLRQAIGKASTGRGRGTTEWWKGSSFPQAQ